MFTCSTIVEIFFNIEDMYNDIDNLHNVLEMYEKALKIQLISLPSNHLITCSHSRKENIDNMKKELNAYSDKF